MEKERRRYVWMLLVVAVATGAFATSMNVPFLFDDIPSIELNPHLRRLSPDANLWARDESATSGRPVVAFSLALNYALHGLDVRGYHAVNILLHAANALLLATLLQMIFRRTPLSPQRWMLSSLIAIVWAVHPLHTSTVAYIVQRTELMVGLFLLLTLIASMQAWTAATPWARRWWTVTAVLGCALGMGSKEVMVGAPLLVLALDRVLFSRSWRELWRAHGRHHLLLAGTWLVLAGLLATGPRDQSVGMALGIKPWHYLLTQAPVIAFYLKSCLWPAPLALYWHVKPATSVAAVWAPGVLIVLLGVTTLVGLAQRRTWSLAGCALFLILAPSSSFVPLAEELAADRRMYLPSAAVLTLLLVIPAVLLRRQRLAWPVLAATAACALLAVTVQRLTVFQDNLTVWIDTVAKNPDSHLAQHNLALAQQQRALWGPAVAGYRRVLDLRPDYLPARVNLANLMSRLGHDEQAATLYRQVLEAKPGHVAAQLNLGQLLATRGDLLGAARLFAAVVADHPEAPQGHRALALVLAQNGQFSDALTHLDRAAQLTADDPLTAEARRRVLAAMQHAQVDSAERR